jgi:hypothetical protein
VKHGLEIERWAFWSPETEFPAQWREYWSQPSARPQQTKIPDDAIPSMHRRRMSALSKLAVQVGLEAGEKLQVDFLVFCSQHGELVRTRQLLSDIVTGTVLSPAGFSQSVHNTGSGLYTIVRQSRVPASSLASGASTFAYGWLEAEAFLVENPRARVLLVSYEDLLPPEYVPYSNQKQCMYAVALVLRAADHGHGLILECAPAQADELLPIAPLFIGWWLSADRAMRITADGQGWTWSRHGS